jgi:hypothetical protein
MSPRSAGAIFVCAAIVSACNGSGGGGNQYKPGGTPTATACPTASGQLIGASPNPVSVAVGQDTTLTLCEAGYAGSFAVNSNSSSCVVTPLASNNVWNIYGSFAGTCTLTVKDSFNNQIQVQVTVG